MPILKYLHQNKEDIFFVDNINYLEDNDINQDNNITTIITGKNSVGKSRLLRGIIIECMKNDVFDKVIAISNTQYHKFPTYRDLSHIIFDNGKYIKLTFDPRGYIAGIGVDYQQNFDIDNSPFIHKFLFENDIKFNIRKFPASLNFMSAMDLFLIKNSKNVKTRYVLMEILKFLGLDEFVGISFFHSINSEDVERVLKTIENYLLINSFIEEEEFLLLDKLRESVLYIKDFRSISLFELDNEKLEKLGFLIENGLIRSSRVKFHKNKNMLNYRDLSSGELSILSLILSLSSAIENNSIICIDEPELNLHPEWQEKIIQLIELISSYYNGCHFFIATHSPQLISGIDNKSTYILDLSKNKVSNIINYKNRSSDFQLTEIFNFPGNNNEYLIRKLLIILNKINSEESYELESESRLMLNNVRELIRLGKINDNDKVKIIFDLIMDLMG
ncbi:AAA family ATPase [Acinetobacter seifertii]|uniref:AAA family ATPase n=1 Tax=Acinetobacter seifertii TaxID=1530123 RepID=UPI00168AD1B5|nr:AAA family ATPase [Acinetobacter seifertii]QNX86942.1 ATP-binding protein [Acinetobacter seifertii]